MITSDFFMSNLNPNENFQIVDVRTSNKWEVSTAHKRMAHSRSRSDFKVYAAP